MKKNEYLRYNYLTDPIDEKEWEKILQLKLPENLLELLVALHSKGDVGMTASEFPQSFRRSFPAKINQWLFRLNKPYRVAEADGSPWHPEGAPSEKTLKLFEVKMKKKKQNRMPKPRRPRKKLPLAFSFTDMGGRQCALYDASTSKAAIWLGFDANDKMLLSQENVAALIPYLRQFLTREHRPSENSD